MPKTLISIVKENLKKKGKYKMVKSLKQLQYNDLYEGMPVYVEYEKEGHCWMYHTREHLFDGIEMVHLNSSGKYYTVDKRGGILTDLEHYISIEGVKLYDLSDCQNSQPVSNVCISIIISVKKENTSECELD